MNEEQQEFWDTIKYGPQRNLEEQISASQQLGEPTPQLLETFIKIADRVSKKPEFANYSFVDDMKSEAVLMMLKYWKRLDLNKCQNGSRSVFAYFATAATSSFIHQISMEKKQQQIKSHLAEHINNDVASLGPYD